MMKARVFWNDTAHGAPFPPVKARILDVQPGGKAFNVHLIVLSRSSGLSPAYNPSIEIPPFMFSDGVAFAHSSR